MAAKKAPAQRRLAPHWKSRIVGHSRVNPVTIKANPLNWRVHPESQTMAMQDAIERLGVVNVVIVNKRSGNIVDGHMRHKLAMDNNEKLLDVLYVDLNPDEEKLALSVINPLAELGAMDPEKMSQLLGEVPREGGPLDELLAQLADQAQGAVVKYAGDGARTGTRGMSDAGKTSTTRVLLEAPDVALIERAIAMTGQANRGKALLMLANHFLGDLDDEPKGQHDPEPQDIPADQLAQALAADAGHP
jgi:hypothetical protein